MDERLSNNRPLIGSDRPATTSLGTRDHINPATGKVQAVVPVCGPAEIDAATRAAVAGQKAWQDMGGAGRRDALLRLADLVERHGDELVRMAALEVGTPVSTSSAALALSWIRYYAGWADKIEGTVSEPIGARGLAYAKHEPIGVIGVIIPWNGPLVAISMTVVIKIGRKRAVAPSIAELTNLVDKSVIEA